MLVQVILTAILFSYWLYKKTAKPMTFQFPINVQTGDVIHSAFGSLLANLSNQGHLFDVAIGVILYIAYEVFEWIIKRDTIHKDIATFIAGYFITTAAKYIPLP
jgi:hypothetical protein